MIIDFDDPGISSYLEGFDRVLGFLGEAPHFHDAKVDEVALHRARSSALGEGPYLDLKLTIYRNEYVESGVSLQLRFWDLGNVSIVLPSELVSLSSITMEDLLEVDPRLEAACLRRLRVRVNSNAIGLEYDFRFTCVLASVISIGELKIADLERFKPGRW